MSQGTCDLQTTRISGNFRLKTRIQRKLAPKIRAEKRKCGRKTKDAERQTNCQIAFLKIHRLPVCEDYPYDLGGHLKKCRSPHPEKCQKSASESAGPKRGAEESAQKVFLVAAPVLLLQKPGTRSTFFSTFLGTPFWAGTFRSTFSAVFRTRASARL